jgi:hypothetical protein
MCSPKSIAWWMLPLILGFFMSSLFVQVQTPVPSELVTVNADGATGTALVVYHPGLNAFQKDATFAFVDGLVSGNWKCEVTTASRVTQTDLSTYDLLVLGAPTYAFKPADPIKRYLEAVGDLRGVPTVLVITGAGSTARAAALLADYVTGANGTLLEILELWQAAPNEEKHGISGAMEVAELVGTSITLP